MDQGTPRRAGQGQKREERRIASSPYARPPTSKSGTSSRLSGLMSSLLSPFRASKSKKSVVEVEDDKEALAEGITRAEAGGLDESAGLEDMATEYERRLLTSDRDELTEQAPPSPDHSARPFSAISKFPLFLQEVSSPSHSSRPVAPASPAFSFRSQDFTFGSTQTPQKQIAYNEMDISPNSKATEALSTFFRQRESDTPLNAIEQAGVLQLLQQAAQSESLPTAFTPNFRAGRSSSASPSMFSSTSTTLNYGASGSGIVGGSSPQSSPYRRRRPIYVGAGYSRRKQTPASLSVAESNLRRSQSDGMLNDMAEDSESQSVADGKRRKFDTEEPSIPRSSSAGSLASNSTPPLVLAPPVQRNVAATQKFAPVVTPSRPSPLWQVSKAAETPSPSPSPPKKVTTSKPSTRAADMMMEIIRQEDAARPKVTREAVLNPYDNADNPVARIPRSRPARIATPRKQSVAAQTAAKAVSSMELLERTMPAELRRDDNKRIRSAASSGASTPTKASLASHPPKAVPSKVFPISTASTSPIKAPPPRPPIFAPAPKITPPPKVVPTPKATPAPKAAAPKKIEMIELGSSSEEEEEEEEDEEEEGEDDEMEEDGADEEDPEDEDQLFEEDDDMFEVEEEEEEEEEEIRPAPIKSTNIRPKTIFKPQQRRSPVKPSTSPSTTPEATFAEPKSTPKSTPTFSKPAPPTIQSSAPVVKAAIPDMSTLLEPAVVSTNFSADIPDIPTELSDVEARNQAVLKSKSSLPTFDFSSILGNAVKEKATPFISAMQDLAKDTSLVELPTFTF